MEGMQAYDELGNVIQDSDYDELESIFSKAAPVEEGNDSVEEKEEVEVKPEPEQKEVEETKVIEEIAEVPTPTKPREEADDLRLQLREQRKQIALMQAKLDRLDKRPTAVVAPKEDVDEDDEIDEKQIPVPPPEVLADIEIYQKEINSLAEERESTLTNLLAIMSVNPKYTDVEEVCSRQRFDDIFEAAASDMVAKEGGDLTTAQLAIELNIWKKPNPYAYMYGIIKKYHPDFADEKITPVVMEKKEEVKAIKKPTSDAPLSALDLGKGGGGKSFGEWTAERIDSMPEYELHKIPKDVYESYLRGDLDK